MHNQQNTMDQPLIDNSNNSYGNGSYDNPGNTSTNVSTRDDDPYSNRNKGPKINSAKNANRRRENNFKYADADENS